MSRLTSGRRLSVTTEYDRLLRQALKFIDPRGSAANRLLAPPDASAYRRAVKPDFILSDGRWVDFKLRVSYREKRGDVAWRPSALYASLRKYIDHSENRRGSLTIIYRHLHGGIQDVEFPVMRGSKVLISNAQEFEQKVQFVDVERILSRLEETSLAWIAKRIREL